MIKFKGPYVNGRFIKTKSRNNHKKLDPGKLSRTIGQWSVSDLDHVDDAVMAARQAFESWSQMTERKRHEFLYRLQKVFRKRRAALADVISSEVGKLLPESQVEVDRSIEKFDSLLTKGMRLLERPHSRQAYCLYHPRGVLGIFGPFNFPLHLPNGNWIAALATGNTVVFKPSELTPFTGQLIAECFHEARFPKGVFNMIQGKVEVGEHVVRHNEVDGIIFVGSDQTGAKIRESIPFNSQKVCILEMGGKNAAVIFKDAPFQQSIAACVKSALSTTGQRCNSLSRIIIHEDLAQKFTVEFTSQILTWKPGYYKSQDAMMGPLVSKEARKKFHNYQNLAEKEGAHNVMRSYTVTMRPQGYYVLPSVHRLEWPGEAKNKVGYRYDEIFGPDVAIYTFRTVEEAIKIHNDCRYGLVASVFTKKKKLFEEMYHHLEVGNLYLNHPTIGPSPLLPFGGIKASGNDYPAGLFAPLYCTYPVAVQV